MSDAKPSLLKRTGLELSFGAVIGFVLSILMGPRAIGFLYEPPSKDAFSCAGSVEKALGQFVELELVVALLGGVALSVGAFVFRRMRQKKS